jgi:hypothetical protein
MNTFITSCDFTETARCLDNKRLGKQRIEALDILRINVFVRFRWDHFSNDKQREFLIKRYKNHPAVLMWRRYLYYLSIYGEAMCEEWINRGFKDTTVREFRSLRLKLKLLYWPFWLEDTTIREKVFDGMKSNLLRKNPVWYSQFGWRVKTDLPYYWPVTKETMKNE